MAFSLRTNIEFDGLVYGLDAPLPSRVISFAAKEFLQVKKRFSQNWWIGRIVRIGAPFGFIPSPAKLETLRHTMQSNISQILLSEVLQQNAAAAANAATGGDSVLITNSDLSTNGTILKRESHPFFELCLLMKFLPIIMQQRLYSITPHKMVLKHIR